MELLDRAGREVNSPGLRSQPPICPAFHFFTDGRRGIQSAAQGLPPPLARCNPVQRSAAQKSLAPAASPSAVR
jgi:hypothetical protein